MQENIKDPYHPGLLHSRSPQRLTDKDWLHLAICFVSSAQFLQDWIKAQKTGNAAAQLGTFGRRRTERRSNL